MPCSTPISISTSSDTRAVIAVARLAYVVVVHRRSGHNDPELIAYPRRTGQDSTTVGWRRHAAKHFLETLQMMTGVNLVHVRIGGAPAVTDLIGGHLQYFCPVRKSIEQIKERQAASARR